MSFLLNVSLCCLPSLLVCVLFGIFFLHICFYSYIYIYIKRKNKEEEKRTDEGKKNSVWAATSLSHG